MADLFTPEGAVRKIRELLVPGKRMMVGITGIPGSGKTTLSGKLAAALPAQAVSMDGFHMTGETLGRLGLSDRKGAPETFEVDAFLACLGELRQRDRDTVWCPDYSRVLHEPVADQIAVTPEHQVVFVEGNYLLLEEGSWRYVRDYLDVVCYIDVPIDTAMKRVALRHRLKNISQEKIDQKIQETDIPNALRIQQTKHLADWIILE